MPQLFEVLREVVWIAYRTATMSFESAITIILTALAVMLAVLAIGIAVLAIMGYAGFKEMVKDAVGEQVDVAMTAKLQEYPQGAEIRALIDELKAQAALMGKIGISPETDNQTAASNRSREPAAQMYPGEEPPNVDNATTRGPSGPVHVDPGTGHN